MTGLALLARDVGVNERTLRRAFNQETLRATRPTPRTLRVPLSERDYIRRSWSLLATLLEALRTEKNVRFALLFGSAAAGTDTPTSDIDLLVDLRDSSLERLTDLGDKLSAITGRRVDLVRLPDAEAEPSFLEGIVSSGRVLVDRDKLWPSLSRRVSRSSSRAPRRETARARKALAGIDRFLKTRDG
jgi:predicted nucleotidyltransferase